MEEEWKQIEEYDNYSVSNMGRVRNDKFGWILTPREDRYGYYNVNLHKSGNAKNKFIHRLVAKYFCENPNEYDVVDHIDRDPKNNHFSNLRWCTQSQNNRNKNKSADCSSRFIGVSFHKQNQKWRAYLKINGKHNHIGIFDTEEEAHEAFKTEVIANGLESFYDF